MALRTFPPVQALAKAAADAMTAAQNARNMVLNRDTKIAAQQDQINAASTDISKLEAVAATATAAITSSTADRSDLRTKLDALAATVAANVSRLNTDEALLVAHTNLLAALQTAMPKVSTGTAAMTGTLLAGGTVDVAVTISPAMADTSYAAVPVLMGGTSILGNTYVSGVLNQTTTTITVRLKNNGLAGVLMTGSTVKVLAVKGTT